MDASTSPPVDPVGGLAGIRVLILSAGYEPVRIVSWKRAMILYLTGKIDVVEFYPKIHVRTVSAQFAVPAVIRMRRFIPNRRMWSKTRFSRQHVFLRDNHTCQYCFESFPAKELTLDHIVPLVRGGPTTWSNVVTCCADCNQRKGARTPQEAGFLQFKTPDEPKPGFLPDLFHYRIDETKQKDRPELPAPWRPFLKIA